MSSDDLTRAQCKAIFEALFPSVNYLVRLKKRMEKKDFPSSDKLYQLVVKAHEAVNELRLEAHAMSASGTGKPDRPE